MQPQLPSAAPRLSAAQPLTHLCCLHPLMALAAESHDSFTILLLTFPLARDKRITSFSCLFILSGPDVLALSSFVVPESESFSRTFSEPLQGCLGCSGLSCTPAMPATHPGRLPNQWSIITCWWRWRMPGPLAVTILGPGSCVPSLSRHMLTSSSVHLQTGSNVPHSQLGGIQGQEGPSAISAWQLLPSFCPFPNIPSFPYPLLIWGTGKEYNTLWCLKHHCFRHKLKAWHPMRCCEENQPHPHQT